MNDSLVSQTAVRQLGNQLKTIQEVKAKQHLLPVSYETFISHWRTSRVKKGFDNERDI